MNRTSKADRCYDEKKQDYENRKLAVLQFDSLTDQKKEKHEFNTGIRFSRNKIQI